MNDADDPSATPVGGPSWMRHAPPAATPASAPAAIAPGLPVAAPLNAVNVGASPAAAPHVYSRHGTSPLPYGALALASVVALWVAWSGPCAATSTAIATRCGS
ncbi:MAG: hypothetical protein R2711_05925 [Acidimicrobiales bacterium]